MPSPVQIEFRLHQQAGWPGSLSRPNQPSAYDVGQLNVPAAATRNPRPGDAVYWNSTDNQYQLVTTSGNQLNTLGIIIYDAGTVQSTLAVALANANSEAFIEYLDGDTIKVGVMGTFYVQAGSAMEYGDLVDFDASDGKWDVRARSTTVAGIQLQPIVCVSRTPVVADAITEVRIGYGRAI